MCCRQKLKPNDTEKLDFWLKGPKFLKESSEYTRLFEEPQSEKVELEVRQSCAAEMFVDLSAFIKQFSSIHRLLRAACWLLKFSRHVRGQQVTVEVNVCEMRQALRCLLRVAQKCAFPDEMKALAKNKEIATSSKLPKLC